MFGNKYYLINDEGKHLAEYIAYSDIAADLDVTRNVIAGKFNRARKKGTNIIEVKGQKFKQVKENKK
ncbi:MAG: hypothetical protein IJ880_11815 [Bacilli bacterium]|nr:hypothetical protein [Bacilli bacterium]